jgi:NAD(P)H-flavin reductase/hemoglobin-like flavoprotein
MRSWNRDVDALAKLRDGLRAIPDDDPPDHDQPAEPQPTAGPLVGPQPAAGPPREPQSVSRPPADAAIAAVRETFRYLAEAGDDAVGYFYAWLFVRHPELRPMFPVAMDQQRDRLFRALTRIVDSLGSPEDLAAYLTQLGRDHRKYAVQPPMYEAVGQALIATLRNFARDAFTGPAEEAWLQAYSAASSLMIRGAEEDNGPARWTAEVVECQNRGNGIGVLTLAPDQLLPYLAGQHVSLQTPRWPGVWRPYSVACRPREDGLMQFHVKAIPGGWVSTALVYHTAPGDQLIIGPAIGTMTLQHAGDRDLLCVAGGTGLSPLKAIAQQVVRDSAAGRRRAIYLYLGARTRDQLYDLHDLWRLSDAYPWLQITPVTSDDPAFAGLQGNVGRVAARYLPHRKCEAYVAGPAAMVRETIRVLARTGIPEQRIHYDDALLAQPKRVSSGS